jgi:hypothetical protein
VRNVEDAWLFFHMLFELIWQYRFLYRDLNDLLSKNRRLETHFQFVLKNKGRAMQQLLDGLARGGAAHRPPRSEPLATSMVVVLTYWLSYEYVRDPRRALEPEQRRAALGRGAFHVLSLLMPHLDAAVARPPATRLPRLLEGHAGLAEPDPRDLVRLLLRRRHPVR